MRGAPRRGFSSKLVTHLPMDVPGSFYAHRVVFSSSVACNLVRPGRAAREAGEHFSSESLTPTKSRDPSREVPPEMSRSRSGFERSD